MNSVLFLMSNQDLLMPYWIRIVFLFFVLKNKNSGDYEKYSWKNLFDKKSVEIVVPPYKVVECLYEDELIELLNDIDDRVIRGTLKKIYMAGKRTGKSSQEVINEIKNTINESDKMTPEIEKITNGFDLWNWK